MQAPPSSLTVPLVIWGNRSPTHCISSILVSPKQDVCVTGSHDGQICLWQLKLNTFRATPTKIFVGHTKSVTCLAWQSSTATSFVSSSDAGEMCLWDLEDSSCVEAVTSTYVHTSVQSYHLVGRRNNQIFCNGYYPDILVYDGNSLALLFRLVSKINSDWITSIIIMKPSQTPGLTEKLASFQKCGVARLPVYSDFEYMYPKSVRSECSFSFDDDVIVGLTISGSMKVWTIPPDMKGTGKESIFENESKQIRIQNAWTLKACPSYPRTMLIVAPTAWHIYDAGDFSLLCSSEVPRGVHWSTGDFLNAEQLVVYATDGTAYLYRLPANSDASNQQFRRSASINGEAQASLFGMLRVPNATPLSCTPAWTIFRSTNATGEYPFHVGIYVVRGDARGRISVWAIPEYTGDQLSSLISSGGEVTEHAPMEITSLDTEWDRLTRRQPGIIDRAEFEEGNSLKITSSLYAPMHGRMFLGMEDGAIVMLPLMQKLCSQFFIGKKSSDLPMYRFLRGHEGKVTALLYPHQDDPRYDPGTLISGGVDFTIRVWDLYQCQLQHAFVCQAGDILQLLTPPSGCNSRVLHTICSIASDHSVALLSLKEKKAIMMASRHVFPIQAVKWRPIDDFLLVQCTDGTVYVWQMETGHLDRVIQGGAAEDVMKACDEEFGEVGTGGEELGVNPTLHLFRAIKNRNIEAARQAAKQGLKSLQNTGPATTTANDAWAKSCYGDPLSVQPVRANPLDQENHLLLFDVEALILQLLAEENRPDQGDSSKSTPRMENKTGSDWKSSPIVPGSASLSGGAEPAKPQKHIAFATEGMTMAMEVAQLLISLLYAWGLDHEMDKLCVEKLGMLQPKQAINYGIISRTGYMTLLLPTQLSRKSIELPVPQERIRDMLATLTRNHWSISSTLSTVHLMTVVSVANTLMNIQNATFHQDYEKRRKLHRRLTRMDTKAVSSAGLPELTQGLGGYSTSDVAQTFVEQQAQVKQTWSQLTAMHCVLLSERLGAETYKPPDIDILIRRWQDRCMEIRTAAQALILSELRRVGSAGRRRMIEYWAVYLPSFPVSEKALVFEVKAVPPPGSAPPDTPASEVLPEGDDDFEDLQQDPSVMSDPNMPSVFSVEYRKKQSIAILLLGIIGAEFGAENLSPARTPTSESGKPPPGTMAVNDPVIRLVAKALSYIVVNQDERLQPYSSLRRSAVDLLGRGFVVWEPFLDVGHVLLSLLRLTLDIERLPPNFPSGVPLSPAADMARAARHALDMIASARPPVFITVTNMEITRHNSLIQSAQTLNINLNNTIIVRAKDELLRTLDMLINKNPQSVSDLIVEVIDVVVHCLDPSRIKNTGLIELFPPIGRFPNVAYCKQNRRIAVGSKKGAVYIYELRGMKVQSYSGHAQAVAACEFAPDGKHLATFSLREGKLLFWQIGATLFGLGSTQPRCIKTSKASTVSWQNGPDLKDQPEFRLARLRWITNKDVLCMLVNGKEEKFSI